MLNSDYKSSLDKSIQWLKGTEKFSGGSSAYSAFGLAWSKAYPETTGYIIKTLLDYDRLYTDSVSKELALRFGTWLLSIQNDNGSWNGGFHPNLKASPSVFNTAQIIIGLHALFIDSKDVIWKEAMQKAALWLSNNVNEEGFWNEGHYNDFNPTYYTRVAWPMLLANEILDLKVVSDSALRVLDYLSLRILSNGSFKHWGFNENKPAFTHTIAYTIRGFLESSIIINDWDRYAKLTEPALEKLYRFAELRSGRLPGFFDNEWNIQGNFSCLTGNVQVAYCFFLLFERQKDLRLINAGTKLIEYNISKQKKSGAIPGSYPLYEKYMRMRYPNWAAKFHADAIMKLDQLKLDD